MSVRIDPFIEQMIISDYQNGLNLKDIHFSFKIEESLIQRVLKKNHVRCKRHGMSRSKVYKAWEGMHARCRNKNSKAFKNYGARGIRVCNRWLRFENFLRDMGTPPTPLHSLDRIDNNGDYEPKNCRWGTPKEQANNRCDNHLVTHAGIVLNITQWAEGLHLKRDKLNYLLNKGFTLRDVIKKIEREETQGILDATA